MDAFPLNGTEWLDTDGDGLGDNRDTNDDGDGVADAVGNLVKQKSYPDHHHRH